MKYILLIAVSQLFYCYSFAQRTVGNFFPLSFSTKDVSTTRDYVDTLKSSSFIPQNEGGLGCFTGVYPAPDSGYVSGNNKYGDLQKAQFFSLPQMGYTAPGYLQGVQVHIGAKSAIAGTSQVFVYLYAVDTGGFRPGDLIGVSNPINIADINATGLGNTFTFPLPVVVADSFFVSIVLPTNSGDTVAVLSTINDCRSFSGWSWEQWSNGSWHTLVNSWILDMDLAIFPIIDLPFNVGLSNSSSKEITGKLFPNPASIQSTLTYKINIAGKVNISIINALGKTIQQIEKGFLNAGEHIETLDVQELAAGYYVVLINDEKEHQAFSFEINK